MSDLKLALEWIPGAFAVCRLPAEAEVPSWASVGGRQGLVMITRTDRELSIVSSQDMVPADIDAERGWVAMRVAGELDISSVGVLAKLTGALADASVPVFALSTYDTDILLVKSTQTGTAIAALGKVADVTALT
jgi:hypothetical protein